MKAPITIDYIDFIMWSSVPLCVFQIMSESLSFPADTEGTNAFIYWYWNCLYWVLFHNTVIPGISFDNKFAVADTTFL